MPPAIVQFNAHCSSSPEPLTGIPSQHLSLIARYAQESDKTASDLAKIIQRGVFPSDSDRQTSAGEGSEKLRLAVLEEAILAVAERVNYGISHCDLASSSTAVTAPENLPAGLQLWRWEVRDLNLLQQERRDEILSRREERRRARQAAVRLFVELPPSERERLLSGKKKAATGSSKASTNQPTTHVINAQIDAKNAEGSRSHQHPGSLAQSSPSHSLRTAAEAVGDHQLSPAKAASEASSKADSGVVILDDDDLNETGSKAQTPRASQSPSAKRDSDAPSVKKSNKKKEDNLTAEQRAERERREREREDKKKAKEEKEAKKQKAAELQRKSANIMAGFFGRASSPKEASIQPPVKEQQSDFERAFAPIAYKDLAPINRFHRVVDTAQLDQTLSGDERSDAAPHSLLSQLARPRQPNQKRKVIKSRLSVRETMRLVAESDLLTGANVEEQTRKALESLQDRESVPIKLLQFATDMRPGWFGTWTRPSNLISGRRPLRQDPVALDYNYDSDAEWIEGEDEGNGEEVGEDDDAEDAMSASSGDSEMDDWLVDDLEEVEEGDPNEDQVMSDLEEMDLFSGSTNEAHRRPSLSSTEAAPVKTPAGSNVPRRIPLPGKAAKKAGGKKKGKKIIKNARRFTQKLVPVILGPHWEEVLGEATHSAFADYQMEFLNDAVPGLDPFTFVGDDLALSAKQAELSEATDGGAAVSAPPAHTATAPSVTQAAALSAPEGTGSIASPVLPIPNDVLQAILRTVEGRTENKPVLVDALFKDFKDIKGVNKKKLTQTVDLVASREGRKVDSPWRVRAEWRSQAELS